MVIILHNISLYFWQEHKNNYFKRFVKKSYWPLILNGSVCVKINLHIKWTDVIPECLTWFIFHGFVNEFADLQEQHYFVNGRVRPLH